MKKSIISIICFLTVVSAFAERVSVKQAAKMAEGFFGKAGKAQITLVKTGYAKSPILPQAASNEPTYYVYNRQGGGWIILSADDNTEKVLAYSFEGEFPVQNTPANLAWWLDCVMSDEITAARTLGVKKETVKTSSDTPRTVGKTVVEYSTALWDQGSPFNGESPNIDGHKCITGCVATAAAIKCRFHEWPYRGSGTTPAYTYYCDDAEKNVTIPENKLGRVYDYDNMPLNYSGGATSAQKAAVAALMYDLGCGTKMMFGWHLSGAYTDNMANALKTYFHYNKNLKLENKRGDETAWDLKLEKELADNGPILYSGIDDDGGGGHAFVFEAHSDDHYFRVNWGWGGSGNGWFRTSSLGGGSVGYKFNYGQDAMFNAAPDKSGIYTPDEVAEMTSFKYQNKILTISNIMKYDIIISKDGTEVKSFLNKAAGTTTQITLSSIGSNGVYTFTIRLSDLYVEFPDSQYSFEFEF